MTVAQNTMAMFLSDRQVSNKRSETFYSTREMPQQLAVGLSHTYADAVTMMTSVRTTKMNMWFCVMIMMILM